MNFVKDYYHFKSCLTHEDSRLVSKMVDVIDRAKSLVDCIDFYEKATDINKESARQTFFMTKKFLESGICELENIKANRK